MPDMPIPGMKVMPALIDEPTGIMAGAWFGCVRWAAGEQQLLDRFKADTGHDLRSLVKRTPLDRMIDSETGHDGAVIAAFADWVTENLWGDGKDA